MSLPTSINLIKVIPTGLIRGMWEACLLVILDPVNWTVKMDCHSVAMGTPSGHCEFVSRHWNIL